MRTYRVTFSAEVRFATEVNAADDKEAHFIAFCDAAGTLQNDKAVRDQLEGYNLRITAVTPCRLFGCEPLVPREVVQ